MPSLFIVCEKVLPLIKHMEVDEKGEYGLTNFKGIKHGMKVTSSDHNATILTLDLSFPKLKPHRTSFFDFKNKEGQMKFENMTTNNARLTECFSTQETFETKVSNWDRRVKSCIFKSFN